MSNCALSRLVPACICAVFTSYLASAAGQNPTPGAMFDAAPFALPLDGNDQSPGLRWGEPRKIRQLMVEWDSAHLPPPDGVQVQYWYKTWNGNPEAGPGGTGSAGWAEMDDWTNGTWKTAQTLVKIEGRAWTFTFAPTGAKEFEKFKDESVSYRKTLKVRLKGKESLPKPKRFSALTEAVYRPLSVRALFGKPADSRIRLDSTDAGTLEIYNGILVGVNGGKDSSAAQGTRWSLPNAAGELRLDLLMAVDPADARYDRTLVTIRSRTRPFTFAADEAARGDRILVDDLGVLVVRAEDVISLEACREQLKPSRGQSIYDRVEAAPEQTLPNAWGDMPPRNPMGFPHGLPGNRNVMLQTPKGEIHISKSPHWFSHPRSAKDTDRKDWTEDRLRIKFGLPDEKFRGERSLLEGRLPVLTSPWKKGLVVYEQITVMDALKGGDLTKVAMDDPTVLLGQIKIANTSGSATENAQLEFSSGEDGETLIVDGDQVVGEKQGKRRLRFVLRREKSGVLVRDGTSSKWSSALQPGESCTLFVAVPSITLTSEEEIENLRNRDFGADVKRICDFWRQVNGDGTVIRTPEPWLNDFYQTHFQHMLINCQKDLGDGLYPHVGTFGYGVYTNESMMMVSDLDRRGHHDLARRCLDVLLANQGSVGLPGNFKSKDGVLYGCLGHESGGYNKHHGYAMWGMAEHWRFTRDHKWMETAAPKLVKACDWIISERKATMNTKPDGRKVFEYGWLPAGGLEDVQDYWYWLATNTATVWGFDGVAAALADFGHPQSTRLLQEAKAYHDDVVSGLTEARILCPVVRLRDGTYVPKFPSRLYERGRSSGWIRETLEGSMFLPVMGLVDPKSIEADWILKDYEDNLYISNQYGYSIKDFDRYWFSRGGFSMQANLLDGPIPYIQRDQPKHFLRAYFNGFCSAFEPPVRMCNEHSLPELGNPAGDMFKTSDEAQTTYWLRLMFVHEQGNDLILGQALPRYWFAQGNKFSIERAASYFGPLSFQVTSDVDNGTIKAIVTPPERNRPHEIFVRVRHPQGKLMRSATVNGQPVTRFNADKEWVVLPGEARGPQEVIVSY